MATMTTRTVQVLDGKAVLGEQEAARFLGVSTRTLRRRTDAMEIPSYKEGRLRKWRVSDLTAYLDGLR